MANAAKPLVSVVVPAWNAERTLRETLDSVSAQTYRRLEILIVDDGSTDRTRKIADEYCSSEPRARVSSQRNGGVASARNHAIAKARGEWIAPVDADDLWHPTKIEKQVAAARAAPEAPGFVYCWCRHIDDEDRVIGSGPRFALQGRAFRQLAYLNVVRNGSALLISRAAAVTIGGYDESLRALRAQGCEDVMIQLRLAQQFPIACVPEHLVGYRTRGEMSGDLDQIYRSWQLVYGRIAAEDPSLERPVLRRVRAKSAFEDAEAKAAAAGIMSALPALFRALALDPARCGSLLLYRLARHGVRAVRGRRAHADAPHFFDVDPTAIIQNDPDTLPAFAAFIDSLEGRRLRALGSTAHS